MQHMRSHQSRLCLPPFAGDSEEHNSIPEERFPQNSPGFLRVGRTAQSLSYFIKSQNEEGPIDMDQSPLILEQLDDRHRVADDNFRFYDNLIQRSEPIIIARINITESVGECSSCVQKLI